MNKSRLKKIFLTAIVLLVCIFLYWLSRKNYLLFHAIAEFYSIIIACCIFTVVWNTKKNYRNNGMVFLGISYLFVGIIDFFHTIAYKGMPVFTDYSFYANQLWLVARFLESSAILFFTMYGAKIKKEYDWTIIFSLMLYTALSMLTIFHWKNFPECFIDGIGQTYFKIYGEYLICFLLFISTLILIKTKKNYDPLLFNQITASIVITILSEFMFTLYTDNYGITNVLGHLLKILSFYLIYRSVIVNMFTRPVEILYFDLNNAHIKMQEANSIINDQKKKLERSVENLTMANQTKDKFFKIIAHDLKNPFNVINAFTDLITAKCSVSQVEGSANWIKYIEAIKETSTSAYRLLTNLLDWANLQTGDIKPIFTLVDLKTAVIESVITVAAAARQKKITINNLICESVFISADKNMLDIVLRNILNNAVKFTNNGGVISISCSENDNIVLFKISDTGVGIPQDIIKDIFNVSSKYSTIGTAGEKGSGLGLILCREYIEKINGAIKISSELNKGTEFTLTFQKH